MIFSNFFRSRLHISFVKQFSTEFKISERKVSVGNTDVNIIESGSGPKSVFLLPGALGTGLSDFKPQIEALPKLLPGHTIISWDPPGYGKSIPPERDFSLDFFHKDANMAKNLMDTLGRHKFSILGWSDGGITGMVLASKYPKAVEKLIIWGANSYIDEDDIKIYESIRDINKWSARMREPFEIIYGRDGFSRLWSRWVDALVKIFKENNGDLCKSELSKLTMPIFILHGRKDPMLPPQHVPFLRSQIKHAKYFEFPEGKHNIHLRYPEEFNRLVADFVENAS